MFYSSIRLPFQPGMGEFPVSVLLADYREVRGLRIPHVMTTKTVEAGDMIMSLQDVKNQSQDWGRYLSSGAARKRARDTIILRDSGGSLFWIGSSKEFI